MQRRQNIRRFIGSGPLLKNIQKENKNSIPQIVLAMQNEIAVSIFVDLISWKISIDYHWCTHYL